MIVKSLPLVPATCADVTENDADPLLETVKVWVALVPTGWVPKFSVLLDSVTAGAVDPVLLHCPSTPYQGAE